MSSMRYKFPENWEDVQFVFISLLYLVWGSLYPEGDQMFDSQFLVSPIFFQGFPIIETTTNFFIKLIFLQVIHTLALLEAALKQCLIPTCGANNSQCTQTGAQSNKHHQLIMVCFTNSKVRVNRICLILLAEQYLFPLQVILNIEALNATYSLLVFKERTICKSSKFY